MKQSLKVVFIVLIVFFNVVFACFIFKLYKNIEKEKISSNSAFNYTNNNYKNFNSVNNVDNSSNDNNANNVDNLNKVNNINSNKKNTKLNFTIDNLKDAILSNDIELVKKIIKSKSVDLNSKDSKGRYPLKYVFIFNNCQIAQLLLEAGADPFVFIEGKDISIYDFVMKGNNKYLKQIFKKYSKKG